MSSVLSEDENFDDIFSDNSQFSVAWEDNVCNETKRDTVKYPQPQQSRNVISNIVNRQIYGRFSKNSKAKTERLFNNIHHKCRFSLSSLIKEYEAMSHIFMGFTICGQYFLSLTEKIFDNMDDLPEYQSSYEYELHLWRFVPGQQLNKLSKHRIFKHLRGPEALDKIMFMQFPMDPHKIVCYGLVASNPAMVYITILTLPSPKSCKHCIGNLFSSSSESVSQGWCSKHGFILHYMFSMGQPCPVFDPHISLAFPDHLVINTGHYIHILNIRTLAPSPLPPQPITLSKLVVNNNNNNNHLALLSSCNFNDTLSEVSESPSEYFGSNSIVDAILDDFNEYDLEGNDCNKPFHELNISCEPLNVTGKSYHNTLVQNIVDPRFKRLQTNNKEDYLFSIPQCSKTIVEKSKVDKKIAEKAYEFIEENEKCEKLSSFRKKRLAEKKYEFSEDNSENIVPFNSLRRERRYLYRSNRTTTRDFNSLFLSPRSPMQSPNSRCSSTTTNNGLYSPSATGGGGPRNVYCTSIRNSPHHHSKSPISPRESTRKFYVYSPNLQCTDSSDCSDSDSRLILRLSTSSNNNHFPTSNNNRFNTTTNNNNQQQHYQQNGLLIVDPKTETPKWIKKVVRRYSNGDFENSSLLSGQSRDDYNIPIEIPLLAQTLNEQHLDVVPDFKMDHVTEMQLIVTQRTFDCEQFVQRRAQKLCADSQLEFLHCEDYDIKINYVCPLDGHIVCQAVIKIGALKTIEPYGRPENYTTHCLFTWNIITDRFEVIEPSNVDGTSITLQSLHKDVDNLVAPPQIDVPSTNYKGVVVMDYYYTHTKPHLRDYNNFYEICLGSTKLSNISRSQQYGFNSIHGQHEADTSAASDSDY